MRNVMLNVMLLVAATLLLAPAAVSASSSKKPPVGGSMQRAAAEGCMNQWLFDGVWRLRVLSVDPAAQYNDGSLTTGVGVKMQLHNATSHDLEPDHTGLSDINGRGITVTYSDDNTEDAISSGTGLTNALLDKTMPPGGGATVTIYFAYGPDKTAKPVKLIIPVDPKSPNNYSHSHYSVSNPSFRVHLDCTK